MEAGNSLRGTVPSVCDTQRPSTPVSQPHYKHTGHLTQKQRWWLVVCRSRTEEGEFTWWYHQRSTAETLEPCFTATQGYTHDRFAVSYQMGQAHSTLHLQWKFLWPLSNTTSLVQYSGCTSPSQVIDENTQQSFLTIYDTQRTNSYVPH